MKKALDSYASAPAHPCEQGIARNLNPAPISIEGPPGSMLCGIERIAASETEKLQRTVYKYMHYLLTSRVMRVLARRRHQRRERGWRLSAECRRALYRAWRSRRRAPRRRCGLHIVSWPAHRAERLREAHRDVRVRSRRTCALRSVTSAYRSRARAPYQR